MELTVADRRVYAYTGGRPFDPSLPVLVFIHGASHDHSVWALQSRYFAHHGPAVMAVDLPGHGRSAGPPLNSIEELADWVVALLNAAGAGNAMLVGHSMGSLIALETAARHPAHVTRLALLGTAVPMPVSDLLLDAARADESRAVALINEWSHSPRAQFGGNTTPGMWMTGTNRRLMQRQAPGVLLNDFNACNGYVRGPESASRVTCPVLLIAGSRDQMTPPRTAAALVELLPDARMQTLAGAGHALMAERPDGVLDALRDFLASR